LVLKPGVTYMLFFPTETRFSLSSSTYNNIIILSILNIQKSSKLVLGGGGNYQDDGILHLIHHLEREYEEEHVCRQIHQQHVSDLRL
jgi:hypothetical protein